MSVTKAVIYLGSFAAAGYLLMEFAAMNEERLKKELQSTTEPVSQSMKRNEQFMNVLKSASQDSRPLSREAQPTKVRVD